MRFFLGEKTTNKGDILQRGTFLRGRGGYQKNVNFICTIKVSTYTRNKNSHQHSYGFQNLMSSWGWGNIIFLKLPWVREFLNIWFKKLTDISTKRSFGLGNVYWIFNLQAVFCLFETVFNFSCKTLGFLGCFFIFLANFFVIF